MRLSFVIFGLLAIVACSTATHIPLPLPVPTDSGQQADEPLVRQKRFTCDLFSFSADGVSGFNHGACAAKCLAQRHFGGYCDGPNCKCVEKKW